MTEMVILLYLDKHGPGGTAADIVERLKITKSHISTSVRDLTQRGYLRGSHAGNDHRAIHLRLCGEAGQVAREGRRVQEEFLRVLLDGFDGAERELKAIRKAKTLAEYLPAAERLLVQCPLRENAVIGT